MVLETRLVRLKYILNSYQEVSQVILLYDYRYTSQGLSLSIHRKPTCLYRIYIANAMNLIDKVFVIIVSQCDTL